MKKLLLLVLGIATIIVGVIVMAKPAFLSDILGASERLKVVSSFAPLGELAQAIGKEHVDLSVITPPNAKFHHYEPTPTQLAKLTQARLILLVGAQMEPWGTKLASLAPKTPVVLMEKSAGDIIGDAHHPDPHFWLDPVTVMRTVAALRDALIAADPAHKTEYITNAREVTDQLVDLHQRYYDIMQTCTNRTVIITHDSLKYLARRYGFESQEVGHIHEKKEPSPVEIIRAVTTIRAERLGAIVHEKGEPDHLARTIAKKTGSNIILFDTLERSDPKAGSYIQRLEANLNALKEARMCTGR